MVASPTPTNWWDDWLKFTPGWLAFLWAFGNGTWQGIRKWRDRRHKLALGPEAEELRSHLRQFRVLLEEVTSGSHYSDWFLHEERKQVARDMRDAAGRRDDETLKSTLTRLADAWTEIFALAPPSPTQLRSHANEGDGSPADQNRAIASRQNEDLARIQQMTDLAHAALADVEIAFERLNALEHRTHGR
ncbi:hypothetical protein [Streptomyces sp. NPDC002671]